MRLFLKSPIGLVVMCVFVFISNSKATVWYVTPAPAPGTTELLRDGTSWATAFHNLQDAIYEAQPQDEIWVASGTYTPTHETNPGDPRSATFYLDKPLAIYGGFLGNEIFLSERAGLFTETILSGDLGVPQFRADNADHVVTVTAVVYLDGFKITNGYSRNSGGGILGTVSPGGPGSYGHGGSLLLNNSTVTRNAARTTGGGLSLNLGSYYIANSTFSENFASRGGAIHAQASTMYVYNSRFVDNRASRGGAIYLPSIGDSFGSPYVKFFNSVFYKNSAGDRGGAAFLTGALYTHGSADWVNCVFVENHAALTGGAIHASIPPTPMNRPISRVWNSVVWANSAGTSPQLHGYHQIESSSVEGMGALSIDPEFIDQAAGDFRLKRTSLLIDRGNNQLLDPQLQGSLFRDRLDLDNDGNLNEALPVDLLGRPRFFDVVRVQDLGTGPGPVVDIGAFELQ